MDERTFEFGNLSVEVAARTIEFWRGEYAKRRVFVENKDNYQAVEETMGALMEFAEHCHETAAPGERLEYERDYEVIILNMIADDRPDEISTPKLDKALLSKLQAAYDLSIQYGYVISDLSLNDPLWVEKEYLLHLVGQLEENYWKKVLKVEIPQGEAMEYKPGTWIPRFYGPNSNPWHRTHLLSSDPLPTIKGYDVQPDIAFAVNDIGDDEFQIRSTVGKIETELCSLRIHKLHKKQEAILTLLKELALETDAMLFEDRQLFKKLEPTKLMTFFDTEIHRSLLDTEKFRLLCMQFPETKKTEAQTARSHYVAITKEMLKLFKRISISTREMLSGPYKGENAEVSRAKGLYLWDTVHIEGKADKEALEDLKRHIANHCEGILVEDSPKDNKQIKRLRITEKCIKENRFLPMS